MTMNDTWGYKSDNNNWKSTETLVRNLIDIVSKGGNYLLNVGPTSEGLIPEASVRQAAQDRHVDEGQWRVDLRRRGLSLRNRAGVGAGDAEARQALFARLRLARQR